MSAFRDFLAELAKSPRPGAGTADDAADKSPLDESAQTGARAQALDEFQSPVAAAGGFGSRSSPGPVKLKRLSESEIAQCNKYLKYHDFAALQTAGKTGIDRADYQPGLDNKATDIDKIVEALGPFTALNPVDELRDLVTFRYSELLSQAIVTARAEMQSQGQIIGPSNLVVKGGNHRTFLTWSAAPEATGYNIYRSTKGGDKGGKPIMTTTATAQIDQDLPNDKSYFYRVTATTPDGESPPTYEASAKTQEAEDFEFSVAVKRGTADKQLQYNISLQAKDENSTVQPLPGMTLTINVDADGKAMPVQEAQINLIKAEISKNVKLVGKITIEAQLNLSGKANVDQGTLKSIETSIQGELKVSLGRITLKGSVQADPAGGKTGAEGSVAVVLWRF